MACQNCGSDRVMSVNAKCNDMCVVNIGEEELVDYVPRDMGIGGGDYVNFELCLDCGQMQGEFPLPPSELEEQRNED